MSDGVYLSGFHNEFATEALRGALPQGQNSPQRLKYGLYAEQLSGTAFCVPRENNRRSWLYRIRPSVLHSPFKKMNRGNIRGTPFNEAEPSPNQMRWDPLPLPKKETDFLEGLHTMGGNGDSQTQVGYAVHIYACNQSMDRFFYNSDGDFLIVPQVGGLHLRTEFGSLTVKPGEIAVIHRGMKFQVFLMSDSARGYVCENYGEHFRLPQLGPIGANGLANPRDFQTPVAAYENKKGTFQLVTKLHGQLWVANVNHSPLDVVAWHGNYAPYKYDLNRFQVVNTVSFDHPDPSIFTVLTSPTADAGFSNIDFVIFPTRWMVAENTFRPPYYHRNIMSEFMGNIVGQYDAKGDGFLPGGSSLHNCMSAHGPDAASFKAASTTELKPDYYKKTLSFMIESRYACIPTRFAMETEHLQKNYHKCWAGLTSEFSEEAY